MQDRPALAPLLLLLLLLLPSPLLQALRRYPPRSPPSPNVPFIDPDWAWQRDFSPELRARSCGGSEFHDLYAAVAEDLAPWRVGGISRSLMRRTILQHTARVQGQK